MTWLIWRQHRLQALSTAGALGLVGLFMALTGAHMSSVYHDSGLSHCLATRGHGDCGDLESAFESRFSVLRQVGPLLLVLPLLLGFFWGAPLLAGELEHGTHRLAWTQSIGRLHWLAVKLVFVTGFTALVAVVYALVVSWWSGPLDASTGDRFQPGNFDQQGLVPVAYALFAVALGTAAGAVIRKTLAAMAVTLGGFLAVRVLVAAVIRRHFVSPVTERYAPVPGRDTIHAGAWVLSQRTLDGQGHRVSEFQAGTTCHEAPGATLRAVDRCIRAHGFINVDVLQPAARFWLFQGIESALFAGLAAALLAFTVCWVRGRLG
jgi:hypothetical protein